MLISSTAIAQKKVERKLPLGMEGALRVVNMVGSVTVHGWNKDTVLVRGALGAGDTFFMGGGYTGAKMFVESANDRDPKPSRLELWVPARVRLWIKTATANIDVSDVAGGLDLYVVSGTIDVSGHPLTVTEAAHIDAEVKAHTIIVAGNVNGRLNAEQRIVVQQTATVTGEVSAPALTLHEGALVQGRLDIAGHRQPVALKLAV